MRWLNLGSKVFWYDEVFTALRVTGHFGAEVNEQLFNGEPVSAGDILQYQTFAPGSSFYDTLRSLVDHPEHPPLFYLLCWAWVKHFGTSLAAFRGVSALASTLTFIALPFLAWELFASATAVVVLPVLFAFSPVHLLYAQEARQYALWTLLIVVTTWALRRAVRLNTWLAWSCYVIGLTLTFYTSVLSLFVLMAYGAYGLWALSQRQRWTFGATTAAAILLFTPWLGVMWVQSQRLQSTTSWTTQVSFPLDALVKLWGLHFTAVFFDPNLPLENIYSWTIPPLFLLLLAAVSAALWKALPPESSVLLLLLIWVPTICLIGGDLVRGSILSKNTRYFVPALIGSLVAIGGWLSLLYSRRSRWAAWGIALTVGLGMVSSIAIIQAPTWWNKSISYHNRDVAQAIAGFESPVVLTQSSGTALGNVMSISHYLPASVMFVMTTRSDFPQAPEAAETVLLYQPTEALKRQFACPPEALPVSDGLFLVPCASNR
ncbi:MAG: glycosyltransferase family 39 protein [Cyanobacteria bacterium P01_C01_bin.120]